MVEVPSSNLGSPTKILKTALSAKIMRFFYVYDLTLSKWNSYE